MIRQLTNTRRHGDIEDLSHLYYIRELIERKSGGIARLRPKELTAIVAAAYYAIGNDVPEEQQSGENLFRQLRRFAVNNPAFLTAVQDRIDRSMFGTPLQ